VEENSLARTAEFSTAKETGLLVVGEHHRGKEDDQPHRDENQSHHHRDHRLVLLVELATRAVETWLIAVEAVEAVERAVEAVERAVETDTFGVEGAETQEFEEDVDIFELK
jgi:hypothetical protein